MIDLLERYGDKNSNFKGQNYLINIDSVHDAIKSINAGSNDKVLEIGPGLGFITDELRKEVGKVIAIERDPELVKILNKEYDWNNVDLLSGDILRSALPHFNKILSNIPFQISSQIINKLGEMRFEKASLILQRSFAEKITSKDENRTRISIKTQSLFHINILREIRKDSFIPKPNVNACLVVFEPKKNPITLNNDLVRAIYQHKKKKLRNSILDSSHELSIEEEKIKNLRDDLPYSEKRVYELSPKEIREIQEKLLNEFSRI